MNATDASRNWLSANQQLRMDANVDLFPEDRRRFHLARYEFAAPYCQDKAVLDGACGTGYGSGIVGGVARKVVGIDFSAEAIDYANRTYGGDHVSFQRSFVESTPFPDGTFDVVLSFETVEHTLCPESHMMEVVRLLKADSGVAILSVPNAWGLTDHHFLDFTAASFEKLISPFFRKFELFHQNSESHGRYAGIGPLRSAAPADAQCVIAICSEPIKEAVASDRYAHIMDEIYRIAFSRHHDFLTLQYRAKTSLLRRIVNKLRSMAR